MARKASTAGKSKSRRSEPPSARKRATIDIKRVYDEPSADEGLRILVDRLWPRGVTKASLALDAWPKELTPSNDLRKWYGHAPEKFDEFRRRYLAELAPHRDKLDELRALVRGRKATLLTATRELDLSHAHVLRDLLTRGR
jgi:uncharacterized protein YeaO (DUF488 family)